MSENNLRSINWSIILYVSFFLGSFGVDRFMMGKIPTGVLKLITFGGLGIWWLIDLILILVSYNFKGIEWEHPESKTVPTTIIIILLFILGYLYIFSFTLDFPSSMNNQFIDEYNTRLEEANNLLQEHDNLIIEINENVDNFEIYREKIVEYNLWVERNRETLQEFRLFIETNHKKITDIGINPDYVRDNVIRSLDTMQQNQFRFEIFL